MCYCLLKALETKYFDYSITLKDIKLITLNLSNTDYAQLF